MKHFSLFKNIALACLTLASVAAMSSCTGTSAPMKAAAKLRSGVTATVYSYDDAASPMNRDVYPAGPLPARTERALYNWLRDSVVKEYSYAYPQYYVSLVAPGSQTETVWGICSDGQGNMTGVLIPKSGRPAWDAPFTSEHTMYVCDSPQRKALSDAIMSSLADAGYDKFRIDTRKAAGLTQQRYLISKPLSDEAQKKYDRIKQAEEQAAAAREARAEAAESAAENDTEEEEEESSDDFLNDMEDDLDEELEL